MGSGSPRPAGERSGNNYADLPPFKKTIEYKDQVGSYTQQEGLDDAEWLTLDSLFANMPHKMLYSIDLKGMAAEKCEFVYEIIVKHR